jgi:hypothetical protein
MPFPFAFAWLNASHTVRHSHKNLDKATCILPSGKDWQLSPIKTKADLPKYQVIMKNYFNIPNPMAFSNVSQDGGRVIEQAT